MYELVPEAYRQKFRHCRKENYQTRVDFARTKENYLTEGALQKKIGSNYAKRRQLIQVEEFKRSINSDVKSFLDAKKVETFEKTARLADVYILIHKLCFVNKADPRKPFYPPSGPKSILSVQFGNFNHHAP